ncbi:hypothetical protein RJ639_004443 [Escallonia herrerae]|uniref:Uncharacterized protein n=1 Tax=Escallonia herrerae TaxID=1293975 RepID=A0AA89AZC5_9ASTE|nr:hypothetical protein RJ639_004443 [Escallonia herrerae]
MSSRQGQNFEAPLILCDHNKSEHSFTFSLKPIPFLFAHWLSQSYLHLNEAQAGPITCGKPILRATVPSLCHGHFQKAQMHVTRALKKAGLNSSSSSKLAPKFHVIVTEYVREIQRKRRAALGTSRSKVVFQHRDASYESPDNGLLDLENMREKSK